MKHVILVTHWTGGDVLPFIRLGGYLVNEGYKVSILTHCVYRQKAESKGLRFCAVDNEDEYNALSRDLHMLSDPISHREDYINFCNTYHGRNRLLREVEMIERICDSDSLIIARFRSSISGLLAAEKNSLPYASLILAPNYFSHMELHDQLMGKELIKEINSARSSLGLQEIRGWKAWMYSPKHILCGWPEWYASTDETWPVGAKCIGFLQDPNMSKEVIYDDVTQFMDKARNQNKKVLIITGGSSRMVSDRFYSTAAEACIFADVFALIVTPFAEYIPKGLPESIKWASNIQLNLILRMADGIIHHGGMGTINEAIDAGIPQIVMPHLTDGPDNADRLVHLGLAYKFSPKQWAPEKIADAIVKMQTDEQKKQCMKYKLLNANEYDKKPWLYLLPQIKKYELPAQQQMEKDTGSIRNEKDIHLTRQQILELVRKRKEVNNGVTQ